MPTVTSKLRILRRTAAQIAAETLEDGRIVYVTDEESLVVGDGSTLGASLTRLPPGGGKMAADAYYTVNKIDGAYYVFDNSTGKIVYTETNENDAQNAINWALANKPKGAVIRLSSKGLEDQFYISDSISLTSPGAIHGMQRHGTVIEATANDIDMVHINYGSPTYAHCSQLLGIRIQSGGYTGCVGLKVIDIPTNSGVRLYETYFGYDATDLEWAIRYEVDNDSTLEIWGGCLRSGSSGKIYSDAKTVMISLGWTTCDVSNLDGGSGTFWAIRPGETSVVRQLIAGPYYSEVEDLNFGATARIVSAYDNNIAGFLAMTSGTAKFPFYTLRHCRGTLASPEAVQSGDKIGRFNASAHDGTDWASDRAHMDLAADGDWSEGDHPTRIEIATTPAGSTTATERLRIHGDGTIEHKSRDRHATATVSAVGPTDDVDVSGVNVLLVNTGSNHVTIGGLAGGVSGQVLRIVIVNATNNTTLEHNEGGGSQDVFLESGGDETKTASYGGWTLVCNGTHWYQCG